MAKFTQMVPAQADSRDRSNSGGGKRRRRIRGGAAPSGAAFSRTKGGFLLRLAY